MGPLVAVILPPSEAVAVFTRAWEAGQAVLPLDPRAPAAEISRQLDELRPTHLVDATGTAIRNDGTPVAAGVAAVVATSGTTGAPRGVELTAEGLRASAAAVGAALDIGPGDRWLSCLPVHHVAGLGVVARAWASGVPATVVDRYDADAVATATEGRGGARATLVSLVPTVVGRAVGDRQAAAGLRRFRHILVGGAPLAPDVRAGAAREGLSITATYGMTETWGGVVHDGQPLAGVEVRCDQAVGEIEIRGPMTMRGYRFRPDDTAAAFTIDGWYRTGDAGRWDGGRLVVVDRLRDLVLTGGVSVSPGDVEAVLALHPGVADVCVTGVPDPEWGERVVAYVVPADAADPPELADLRRFASGHLAAAKLPREVVVTTEIPRTGGGKSLRRLLRDPQNGAQAPAADG